MTYMGCLCIFVKCGILFVKLKIQIQIFLNAVYYKIYIRMFFFFFFFCLDYPKIKILKSKITDQLNDSIRGLLTGF